REAGAEAIVRAPQELGELLGA
ncbi:MAG: hypothetical protein QOD73_3343, partial [Solirubrobacteraceae bacterium]|nr:hypothetical protein [Solirubrobacteraceae bacterium]